VAIRVGSVALPRAGSGQENDPLADRRLADGADRLVVPRCDAVPIPGEARPGDDGVAGGVGAVRDVGDDAVVDISPDGTVNSKSPGLTTVSARALGQVATAQIGVIENQPGPDYPRTKGNNFIDDLVFVKLRRMNVPPAPLS
jgi:hypothetical protein